MAEDVNAMAASIKPKSVQRRRFHHYMRPVRSESFGGRIWSPEVDRSELAHMCAGHRFRPVSTVDLPRRAAAVACKVVMGRPRDESDSRSKFSLLYGRPSTSMRQLRSMLAWCQVKLSAGTFALHHHRDDTAERGSIQYARFTFARYADASAFRRAWLDG